MKRLLSGLLLVICGLIGYALGAADNPDEQVGVGLMAAAFLVLVWGVWCDQRPRL